MNLHLTLSTKGDGSGDCTSSVREPTKGTDSSMQLLDSRISASQLPVTWPSYVQVQHGFQCSHLAKITVFTVLGIGEILPKCVPHAVLSCLSWHAETGC
jgi:hypothetical protein